MTVSKDTAQTKRIDAAIRLAAIFVALAAIFWGLATIAGHGAACVVTGALVWFDLTRDRDERNSERDSRSISIEQP